MNLWTWFKRVVSPEKERAREKLEQTRAEALATFKRETREFVSCAARMDSLLLEAGITGEIHLPPPVAEDPPPR